MARVGWARISAAFLNRHQSPRVFTFQNFGIWGLAKRVGVAYERGRGKGRGGNSSRLSSRYFERGHVTMAGESTPPQEPLHSCESKVEAVAIGSRGLSI